MNITVASLTQALAIKGNAQARVALRNAVQDALESAPVDKVETYARYFFSACYADVSDKKAAKEIAQLFLVEALVAAPAVKRDAVETAIDELLY